MYQNSSFTQYHIIIVGHYYSTTVLQQVIATLPLIIVGYCHSTTVPQQEIATVLPYYSRRMPHYHSTKVGHCHTITVPYQVIFEVPHFYSRTEQRTTILIQVIANVPLLQQENNTVPEYFIVSMPQYSSTIIGHATITHTIVGQCHSNTVPYKDKATVIQY